MEGTPETTPVAQPASETPAPAPKAAAAKPKQVKKVANDPGVWRTGRRDFLQAFGWLSFLGFLTVATLGALRMMFPRILFERPPVFKAGRTGEYTPNTVNEKYKDTERTWIIRDGEKLIALSATCTHLGCTPRWLNAENKFKCPCHGSGFRGLPTALTGINYEGPAPRALDRYHISIDESGEIIVDKSKKFLYESGEWEKAGAFLKM